jgi:hypothetical protein
MNALSNRSEKIARLNDRARAAMGLACRLVQTPGINALSPQDQSKIREKVETFNAFTPDDDPHGERDFGAFDHQERRIFWKIDYYDKDLMFESEDPADVFKKLAAVAALLLPTHCGPAEPWRFSRRR